MAVHVGDAKVNFGIAREGVAEEKRGCALRNHISPVFRKNGSVCLE